MVILQQLWRPSEPLIRYLDILSVNTLIYRVYAVSINVSIALQACPVGLKF